MINPESYCREIESYLCRKNDGHLIRIVGPAFEHVSRWANEGIPINVAYAGIDRYFERYYRKGPRRRPVRIEFCEADVLDAFDDWRRAVGVTGPISDSRGIPADASPERDNDQPVRRRASLASHIERVIARLTALRASSQITHALRLVLEQIARELDALQPAAKRARGAARGALLERLAALDRTLMTAALEMFDGTMRSATEVEAREALRPFRDRMAPEAYQRALAAATERSVRDRCGLPSIAF